MPSEPSCFLNVWFVFLDTGAHHQQQVNIECLLGTEIDNLRAQIEKKENEILEKDKKLDELQVQQTELDEQLKAAQLNSNEDLINLLKETKEGLVQKLKHGQDELKTLKEDKTTYKNTVDFIVTRDSQVKKHFLKKHILLQGKIKSERENVAAIKQVLDRVCSVNSEYQEQMKTLSQEKHELKQRFSQQNALHKTKVKEMTELIQHLGQQIDEAYLANQDHRSQFEKKQRALQAQSNATIADKAEEIKHMTEQIDKTQKDSEEERAHFQDEQRALQAQCNAAMAETAGEIKNLREQIEQTQMLREEEQRALQTQHETTVTEMTETIEHMKDEIQQLEESLKRASASPPSVSGPRILNNNFMFNQEQSITIIHLVKINI